MQIKIPMVLVKAFDAIHAWGYTPLWSWKWITVRRIDPVIAVAAILCTGYYYWIGGIMTAITGLLAFIFVGMIALWIL